MKRFSLILTLLVLIAASAGAQTSVRGSIVGADGTPLRLGHVHLKKTAMQRMAQASVTCSPNGDFEIDIPSPGMYVLECTGVDHQVLQIPLLAVSSDPIELDARLAANNIPAHPTEVLVIGDFNDWSFREPRAMTPRGDGTFAIEIATTADSVAYQVMFPIGAGERAAMRSVNGTHAESFVYDGGGDYRSVVRSFDGVARITFDPARAPRADASARVTYSDPSSLQARYSDMVASREARLDRFYRAIRQSMANGTKPAELPLDADTELRAAVRNIENERHPVLREVAMVHYFTMKAPRHDTALARRALRDISPSSSVWEIDPSAIAVATRVAGDEAYFERVLSEHPSQLLRAQLMYDRLIVAHYDEDTVAVRRWFNRLVSTFPETELASSARRGYNPDRLVHKGARVPSFAARALFDGAAIDSQSIAGRYVLLDFWATWCVSCVSDVANLEKMYEKYGGDDFEIVSLSFDAVPEMVTKFRESKLPMPWTHGYVDGGFESELARRFEVQVIPKPILVNPQGVIVAMENELRGERLEQTLVRFLGEREMGTR